MYVGLHAIVGYIVSLVVGPSKVTIFYAMRCMLGAFSAYSEAVFYTGVDSFFGADVSLVTFVFLLTSTGMFTASTSYLPSTFAMYCFMSAYGKWLVGHDTRAVFFSVLGVLLGWPFAAVAVVPMALNILWKRRLLSVIGWGISSVFVILVPMVEIDHYFYGKYVLAVLNIVKYNSAGGDSVLYGVEPWWFYLVNSFLNFNVIFILAVCFSVNDLFCYFEGNSWKAFDTICWWLVVDCIAIVAATQGGTIFIPHLSTDVPNWCTRPSPIPSCYQNDCKESTYIFGKFTPSIYQFACLDYSLIFCYIINLT
jgi:alpha-1,2-mannosyltransferase